MSDATLTLSRSAFATFLLGVCLVAQAPPPVVEAGAAIDPKRVQQIVSHLASDAMAGRDTPSRGLENAAAYIAAAFAAAGLQPVTEGGGFFHVYELPGQEIDAADVKLVLHLKGRDEGVELRPHEDVRVYLPTGARFEREATPVTVVPEDQSARLRRSAARNPVLIAVDPKTSALWGAVAGKREVLARRRGLARAPMLLVAASALPAGEIEHATVVVGAARQVTLELKNVVGMLPGGERKDEYVMFSSHYDHVGIGLPIGGDAIYNGADDDATGTAAVVALAEAFAKAPPETTRDRSLLFVCFSGEEKGLLGSRAFAAKPPLPLEKIAVDLNLEMLGRPDQIKPKQAWVTGREYSDFEAIVKIGFARAGIECVEFAQARMLFNASDNASLARKGVVAHSISAGSLHQDYHRPSDEVERLDMPHLTAVIRGIFAAGVEFATREKRPEYNEEGRRVLRLR